MVQKKGGADLIESVAEREIAINDTPVLKLYSARLQLSEINSSRPPCQKSQCHCPDLP